MAAKKATAKKPSGKKPNWDIKPLPARNRIEPREGSLRARCLAKMQKGGLTLNGAIALCRDFDRRRKKPTNEGNVRNRAYALIRLVATKNGYGAKEKNGKVKTAV